MAKITTPSYVTGISGKVCGHESDEYRTNSSSGKIILAKKCNPFKGEATAKQKTVRENFKSRAAVIRAWLSTNRPTKTNTKGTELYQEAIKLKKLYMLDNIQSLLSEYQAKTSPWAIKLPSEGGVRMKKNDSAASSGSNSDSGSSSNTPGGGGGQQDNTEDVDE